MVAAVSSRRVASVCARLVALTGHATMLIDVRCCSNLQEVNMISETTLSPGLRHELAIVTATGLYSDPERFLADAVRTFLAARPDLREAMACTMYARGEISLGRAAEWSGLDIETLKDALHRRGISRAAGETAAEMRGLAEVALQAAGRQLP